MDVGRGKREFSVGELATEMTMGAAIGGLTAGAGRLIPKGGGRTCRVGNSFAPGTAVAMADGTRVPIEDIQVGDMVLATDPVTGESGLRVATATITGDGQKDLVDIDIADGGTITATDGHPFWVANRGPAGDWVGASGLQPGDALLALDGTSVAVHAGVAYGADATVHNLTINDIHTYHADAGDTPILVHNCGGVVGDALDSGRRVVGVARAWLANRTLSRKLGGAAPLPNAIVRDLQALRNASAG